MLDVCGKVADGEVRVVAPRQFSLLAARKS